MAKQSQQRRRGGGNQGNAPRQVQRDPAQERVNMAARAEHILRAVAEQRPDIEPVLPADFDTFLFTLKTALRHNPDILKCTTSSIVQACCKAAWDGLALDGREAALVPQSVKVSGRNEPDRYEKHARYNPMVYGLIKQMIDSGLVADAHATLVYEGEPYKVHRGTRNEIEHEELVECRGPGKKIVAVYCMAWLTNGRVKFETMSKADVDAVRAKAATDYVWDKNEGEMTRKTVIRRLRKSIAGGRDIRDAEMMTMFPTFNQQQAALPAPARPDRRDYQAPAAELTDQSVSVFDNFDQVAERQFVDRDQGDPGPEERGPARTEKADGQDRNQPRDQGSAEPAGGGNAEAAGEGDQGRDETAGGADKPKQAVNRIAVPEEQPSDEAGWRAYADEVKEALPQLNDVDEVNATRRAHGDLIGKAPGKIADELDEAFMDAITDLVAGNGS